MRPSLIQPLPESAWNERAARHLLSRAGFGIPDGRVGTLYQQGFDAALHTLVDYEDIPFLENRPEMVIDPVSPKRRREALKDLTDAERRKKSAEWRREEREAIQKLKAWWIERIATTPRPLEEKMTLFWHGHFATSSQKVQSSHHTYHLNDVFRTNATGNFKQLTIAVGQSPNMLRYLDNARSTKEKPNENWARELMELFTMGVGTYSEDDIKNSARAFTGWTADYKQFQYRENIHDFGVKQFLGREGDFDGWDIIDIIFERPDTAEFICRKLWTHFAYEDPEPEVVQALAQTFRANTYELKPVLRQMFASQAFYSERAMGSQIKSPTQFVVQLMHDLKLDNPPYPLMAKATAQLGQDLFYPPNVKGWDGNRAWVNANSLLIRYNLPVAIAARQAGSAPEAMSDPAMMMLMDKAPKDDMKKRVHEAMAKLPPEERRAVRKRFNEASPEERRAIGREVLASQGAGDGWSARVMIAGLPTETGEIFLKGLTARYLSVPLRGEQQVLIMTAFGIEPETEVAIDAITNEQLNAGLHLLFSSAEYQLC